MYGRLLIHTVCIFRKKNVTFIHSDTSTKLISIPVRFEMMDFVGYTCIHLACLPIIVTLFAWKRYVILLTSYTNGSFFCKNEINCKNSKYVTVSKLVLFLAIALYKNTRVWKQMLSLTLCIGLLSYSRVRDVFENSMRSWRYTI